MAGAFFTNVAMNLVSKLGEYLLAPIGRQFGYVLCYKCYVKDLENGVNELETARERVQRSVDAASYNGKSIHTDVQKWLTSVEKEAEEAKELLKQGESANNACFRGWLPNPRVRHPIGRKVKKMTQVIQGLHENSQNTNFQNVFYENTPIGIVTLATSTSRSVDKKEDVLESRASIIEDVMKAIADDKACVMGVYGPGGVGKSKLMEDIERRVKKEKLFDVVATANVSRNPDLKRIQGEIAYALGLKLTNEETARGRADLLSKRLKNDSKKKILIILDNLWKKLELKQVGIPCGDDNRVIDCKLLLTSRYRDVLRTHMGSDRLFPLNELEHGEARRLFERTVEDKFNDPHFKPMVDGVVQKCGGLPLLILSVAKRLKHGDLAEWRNALTNIEGSDVVELNYNDLKDERIRSLFLVCALTSGRISIRDSLVYCMGFGLFKKFSKTIENARDRLIEDLHSLQDSSLLLDSDDTKQFRMHDIFVDVAISIASTKWNALVGTNECGFNEWSNDELRKCTTISFPFVGIDELPEKLDCPNLRMLLLLPNNSSVKMPESFFESMEKLHVLDLTGLSFKSLPSSIEFLKNLKSLCLDFCHLEDVTALGMLKGLQFLSLFTSAIARLPKQIGELTELRFLDLTGCTRLKVIEPGVLGSLVNLEELYMEDSFDQWDTEDEVPHSNASLAELKNMKKLSTLHIAIPHSANLSRDLSFGKLNRHKIQIGDVWDWSGEYKEYRTLKLKPDSNNLLREDWVQRCLHRTQELHLDGLQDSNDNIHDLCVEGFQDLKIVKVSNYGEIKHLFPLSMTLQLEEIQISRCNLMQHIVADADADEDADEIKDDPKVKSCNLRRLTLQNLPEMTSFCKTVDHSIIFFNGQQVSLPWLESLTLSELPKLKEIWSSHYPSDLSNLKVLKVEDCTFLLSIIPSNLLIKLQNLEAITVERCQLIQEVFDLAGLKIGRDVEILARLTELTLSHLPSLELVWNKNPRKVLCFQNLRALKVQNCENLRFLFSSSMAKALGQIKEIEIASCNLMEEIIDGQEEESGEAATTDTLEFPLLTFLSLEELPNLRAFSFGRDYIHYPSLTRLRISRCPNMMTFSSFEGKSQSMTIDTGLHQVFRRINSGLSLHVFFHQNVLFPSLEELTLLSLCGLRRIWHNELPEESFCRLASITIENCENLTHVFPSSLLERFQKLKMIEAAQCTSLEALMEHVAVNAEKRQKRLVLLGLKDVKLLHLPRLNAFVTSSTKATLGLPNLTNVRLGYCDRMRYLFTYDMARTFDKLETLDVSGCNNMKEIVAVEEGEEQKLRAMKFSHLRILKLCSLKSLISFSSGSCAYELPSLKEFTIEDCKAVEVIVGDASCRKLEGNIPTQQPLLLVEKVGFLGMESMKISHMDNVKKIWLDEIASMAFSKLKMLIVEYCEKLLSIFSSDAIFARLRNLENLIVTNCGSLEEVFHIEEFNFSETCSTSTFQLRELVLRQLPKMKHMWSILPQGGLTFACLRSMKAYECESLKSLFPVSVAKSMTQLEELLVFSCGVEEIIVEEGEGVGMSAGALFFPQLTSLRFHELPELKSFYKNSHTSTWPFLKELKVTHCGKMRSFSLACEIQSWQGTTTSENQPALFSAEKVIPHLEKLTLTREDVVMMQQHDIFGNLRQLGLACYHDENVALPSSFLLQRFPNLEELLVGCSLLEEIFPEYAFGHGGTTPYGGLTGMEKPLDALRNLKLLWLGDLCNLRRLWKDSSLMVEILKQIESICVHECHSLSIIFPSPISFASLIGLHIHDCAGLVHMGTCSAVKSLLHLAWLNLRDCRKMEDVVMNDGNGVEEISFPKLQKLILDGLPSLESFSPTNCTFRFPSLMHVTVMQCPKMNIFCKGALRTPKLDKVLLSYKDDEWRWKGDLNTTIQTLST